MRRAERSWLGLSCLQKGQKTQKLSPYPGLRHLEVLRGQAAAGGAIVLDSVCAANTTDASRDDYGYRAVADALLARVTAQLR